MAAARQVLFRISTPSALDASWCPGGGRPGEGGEEQGQTGKSGLAAIGGGLTGAHAR